MSKLLAEWFESKVDRKTILATLIISIIVPTLALAGGFVSAVNRPVVAIFIGILVIGLIFTMRGKTEVARWLIPFAGYFFAVLLLYRSGVRNPAILTVPAAIAIANLFLWRGGGILLGILSTITVFLLGYGEANGIIINPLSSSTTLRDAVLLSILLLGQTGLQDLLMRRLSQYLKEAQEKTAAAEIANQELVSIQAALEERIEKRTADLERTTAAIQRRANQLQAISDVVRSIASEPNLETLLPKIANVISALFGFYHVGIFLLDEKKEYAELRAANSEGGQRMLARGHKLRVGYQGVVGFAARQARARIALDTGEDAVFFDNPDLPFTRSEAALPLIMGDEVIGVLDVQSDVPEAFNEEDIEVLDTLAFQVAIAIQNARLLTQARHALEETLRINRERTRARWSNVGESGHKLGYRFDGKKFDPILEPVENFEITQALTTGAPQQTSQVLAIPIQLRGETIGVIGVQSKEGRPAWSLNEISIVLAAAERAALALENARLVEEAERRAALERMTTEITGKISTSVQYQTIMRTAAEELSRALQAEVLVQIQPEVQPSLSEK